MAETKKKILPVFVSSAMVFQLTTLPAGASSELEEEKHPFEVKNNHGVIKQDENITEKETPSNKNNTGTQNPNNEAGKDNTVPSPSEFDLNNQSEIEKKREEVEKANSVEKSEQLEEKQTMEEDSLKIQSLSAQTVSYKGIALKNPTHVYSETSTSSKPLKSYEPGSILQYRSYSNEWYEATVYVNGEKYTGYIHHSHVENVDTSNQENYQGIALQNPTKVFKKASTSSDSWKSYTKGRVLEFRTFSKNWYEATVIVNGERKTGYIHKSHVKVLSDKDLQQYSGIALRNPTNVYKNASTSSGVWKSYSQGKILKYGPYSDNWYIAQVFVKGKRRIGFIYKAHVEAINTSNQQHLKGLALQNPTNVYKMASTSSDSWKSYTKGRVLEFRTFSKNWYEATVIVNGERKTGYIHKSHVKVLSDKDLQQYSGIALRNPTNVYKNASTSSGVWKSYSQGKILKYGPYSNNWYIAQVFINGKREIGFIHKNHVDNLLPDRGKALEGSALKNPTHVYSKPARNSDVLKSYNKFRVLKFRTFSKNWYEATVYLNGKPHTGYIHVNDVSTEAITETKTDYKMSFDQYVDQLMEGTPKFDGAGKIAATKEEVEYYSNPLNFAYGSPEYFQFLVLSAPAGLDAEEINNTLLKGKGILQGKGQAFVDAAKKYNINEVYLIHHALHETGNGTSTLAKGIPVDKNGNVIRNKDGSINYNTNDPRYYKTVYNMFGYGAYDNDPINGGARYAFNKGWFTPYDAIVGGAAEIGKGWIDKGKDTLYKMKWSPTTPGTGQYATHIVWAISQAKRIYNTYSQLTSYTLIFDIPQFSNMPKNTYGKVSVNTSLNVRSGPSTSYSIVGSLTNGRIVKILDQRNGWYQVSYNSGKIGWVSGAYINLL